MILTRPEGENMRSEKEIEDMLNNGMPDGVPGTSKFPGLNYEEGVDATVRWVLSWTDESPMED